MYSLQTSPDPNVITMLLTILSDLNLITTTELDTYNTYVLKNIFLKTPIYQIIPISSNPDPALNYAELLPVFVITVVTLKMNDLINATLKNGEPVVLLIIRKT